MDSGRRREVRNTRRLRRSQRGAGDDVDGSQGARAASANVGGRSTTPPLGGGPGEGMAAAAAAAGGGGGRHRSSIGTSRDEAQRLSDRMQQQRQVKSRADEILSQRESLIRERYAPNAMAATTARGQITQQQAAAYAFDKDDLLAGLIGDNRANFLKLDHDLTEDHTIATRRLHSSVFAHANSFLLLFRDVDRASDLVEALKANVQGTKAAISSISKYSSANIVGGTTAAASSASARTGKGAGAGTADARGGGAGDGGAGSVFGSTLGGIAGDGDPRRLARPSLVSRRLTQSYATGGDARDMTWLNDGGAGFGGFGGAGGGDTGGNDSSGATSAGGTGGTGKGGGTAAATSSHATTWAPTAQRSGVNDESSGGGGAPGGGADEVAANSSASRPTTRGLNVSSVRQWRHTIGLGAGSGAGVGRPGDRAGGGSSGGDAGASGSRSAGAAGRRLRGGEAGSAQAQPSGPATAAAKSEKEATDTAAFVDILREEVNQLLTERRHVDAAELLYRLADEATAKGCVPFLLDLEAALVSSVISNVVKIPVAPTYAEGLHVPLIQLLLRFGRSRSAAAVYLAMHTSWLHAEVQRLQSRVNPQYASLIAVDFLVRATRAAVRRQHTLGLTLAAARPLMEEAGASTPSAGDAKKARASPSRGGSPPAATAGAKAGAAGSATTRRSSRSAAAPATAATPPGSLIPPNSAALLWVRRNVERFACEVLATHLLSFGTGTDGGDPTRIRQAAQMIAQTSRVMQALSTDGFAGCDTLILRQLTPSLVILEDDFTRLTGERLEHGGRAMVEQLIMGSLAFYETVQANTAAVTAAATAAAAYAAAAATISSTPQPPPAASSDGKKSSAAQQQQKQQQQQQMPARPPPPRVTPPYQPSRCYDVARKTRMCCQEFVQLIRALPLSGHALLIQLLLAPASSSLFKSASSTAGGAGQGGGGGAAAASSSPGTVALRTGTGGSGGGRGATALLGKAGAPSASHQVPFALMSALFATAPPPPLSAERFRFLRYANGCSSTQVRLLRSVCGYVAALTGTDQLPAEVMASAAAQERDSASANAATAMRMEQAECVAYLLTNAMVTESIDVVLCNLLSRMMTTLLRQRKALVRFLASDAFLSNHRRVFPSAAAKTAGTVSDAPLFSDPAVSPTWVLDSTLCLLADVVSLGTWVSYFTRGGAMTHMLADLQCGFRTQHLERVQREIPRLVQGWLCATLLLSADVTGAGRVLTPSAKAAAAAAPERSPRASAAATPLLAPQQSVLFGSQPPDLGDGRSPRLNLKSNVSFSAVAAAAASAASGKKPSKDTANGTTCVLVSIPVTAPSTPTAAAAAAAGGGADAAAATASDPVAAPLFTDAGVREERVLKLLMTFLDRKYRTPSTYTVHHYVVDSVNDAGAGALAGVWAVRRQLSSYPEFPIGEMREHRGDEVFLLHWCTQISLHLLTFFQERLVTPSCSMNERAAEAQGGVTSFFEAGLPFPLKGCITPRENTMLAALCAGGGNYAAAVSLLQFLVMRLLRDGLCRADTWSAVYGCSTAQWRGDEAVLRQQLFFFALFGCLWAPLFTGGRRPPAKPGAAAGPRGAGSAAAPAPAVKEDAPVSSYLVDGLPPLAVLEWMTCGGVLGAPANTDSVAAAMASAPLATIPANLTAIDVLFATEGTIQLGGGGGGGDGVAGGAAVAGVASGGGSAAWKAKAGGGGGVAAAAAAGGAAHVPSSTSANTTLAKRELFGGGAAYIPDGPLRVVRHFFEEQLCEGRAIPALTSDVMRTRVERAMTEINLLDFVGTSLGADDDSGESTTSTATRSSAGSAAKSQKVTLRNLRDLIAVYAAPLS